MSDRGWDILIRVGGMLLVVAIYALTCYFMEKRWARSDKERETFWRKTFYPEPETPTGKAS